ncbi:MAG: DNA alkylation repair protein [Flavobacteriaceae bacterium]|nr:DNA alkylation repair protein [Flavobacteriaceae bacterium]
MDFLCTLLQLFNSNRNEDNAFQMHHYMKCKFEFFGIKATERRKLLNQAINKHKDELVNNYKEITKELYLVKEREFHMCAIEIFEKYSRKRYTKENINIIQYLLETNSWWDTVDYISKHILGKYLLQFPEETESVISKFLKTKNRWLIRSTILFQLGYNDKTNQELLFRLCKINSTSNEFFIKKAIGWALREYGKTNPQSVLNFVNSTELKPLSKKEAIRNII